MLEEYLSQLHKHHNSIIKSDITEYIEKGTIHTLPIIVQFYGLCNYFEELPGDIELKTLDLSLKSEEDILSAMSILSAMAKDAVFTDIFAFSAVMCISAGDYSTQMGVLRPFTSQELSKGIFSILFISGASNFPFTDNICKLIASSFCYYGVDMPPRQLFYNEILAYLDDISISDASKASHAKQTTTIHHAIQTEIKEIINRCG